jgi:hypothetical protein
MRRRILLQFFGSVVASLSLPVRLRGQAAVRPVDAVRIRALADVVLPGEIGAEGRDAVVKAFVDWHAGYRPGADADHGYGFTRLRRTGASPAARYAEQLDGLDAEARRRGHSLADLPIDDRHSLVEAAIAAAGIERLPPRPDGRHVAVDLMGFYFNSGEANDHCYRARIGRDTCRGLEGSDERPATLTRGGR